MKRFDQYHRTPKRDDDVSFGPKRRTRCSGDCEHPLGPGEPFDTVLGLWEKWAEKYSETHDLIPCPRCCINIWTPKET